jgi:hypothetical protein
MRRVINIIITALALTAAVTPSAYAIRKQVEIRAPHATGAMHVRATPDILKK